MTFVNSQQENTNSKGDSTQKLKQELNVCLKDLLHIYKTK